MFPIEIWTKLVKGLNLIELYYVSLVNKDLRKLIVPKLERRLNLFKKLFRKELEINSYLNIFFLELNRKDYFAAQYIFENKLNKFKKLGYIDQIYDEYKISNYHFQLILNKKKGDKDFYSIHIFYFDELDDNLLELMIKYYHVNYPQIFWKYLKKIYVTQFKVKTSEYFLSVLSRDEVEIQLGKYIHYLFKYIFISMNIFNKNLKELIYILELFRKILKNSDEIINNLLNIIENINNKKEFKNYKLILNSNLIERGYNSELSQKIWYKEINFDINFFEFEPKDYDSESENEYNLKILNEKEKLIFSESESENEYKKATLTEEEDMEETAEKEISKHYFDISKYDSEEELEKDDNYKKKN